MQGYRNRVLESEISKYLEIFPVVALIGPRQCGKSTLAARIISDRPGSVYLDLESRADLNRVENFDLFVAAHDNDLICLDEIQRVPEIFSDMRPVVDRRGRPGQFLILGSASRDLLRQSSETLAGRIGYLELTPFMASETDDLQRLWLRGGFPRSYLARDEQDAALWRENFILTYLERDIPTLGFKVSPRWMGRLWSMCAALSAEQLNISKLADALGVSRSKIREGLDTLLGTFMLGELPPYSSSLKKRMVKSPKLHLRDTGLLHSLLGISHFDQLLGSPRAGASYETFVINQIIAVFPSARYSFYRTQDGAEIDLLIETGKGLYAVECKLSTAPKPTRGFWQSLTDLKIDRSWVIAPVEDAYPIEPRARVASIGAFIEEFSALN